MLFRIPIKPLGAIATIRDWLFSLVAVPLSIPLTHPWNRTRIPRDQWEQLRDDIDAMVALPGDPSALKGHHPIRSHVWFLGGWRSYAVLQASFPWRVGWIIPDGKGGEICEVSRIVIKSEVKMLCGPFETRFFALDAESGIQLHLGMVGGGRLGRGDANRDIVLL